MKLGEKIAQLLKTKRMTKIELTRKMGLKDSSVVSHWVRNRFHPDRNNLVKLAYVFEKPVEYFADDSYTVPAETEDRRVIEAAERRLYDAIRSADVDERPEPGRAASHVGVIGGATGDIFRLPISGTPEEYLPVLVESYGEGRVFALKVKSDELEPTAREGDYLIISPADCAEDGKLALIKIGSEYALRRLVWVKNMPELRAENPKAKQIRLKPGQFEVEGLVSGIFRRP